MRAHQYNVRGLRKDFVTPRTNCDVHRSIKLCPITKLVMSTPQMQRLKGLKQLGCTDQTYMCATHTRFEHSIGVAGLAEQLLEEIRERQPKLNITDKDIVCVKLAGLLHDLGHGPYSHVYDGKFRNQLSKAERRGSWLGVDFDSTVYKNLPEVKKNWQHEDASLEMIDGMLGGLGLAIDESNLDKPLKQIGHGVDALAFGIWDRSKEPERHISYDTDDDESMSEADDIDDELYTGALPPELVLTSRDWIFIKECVVASPLPPKGVSCKGNNTRRQFVGRPDHKEFLYDVVSNRHSGLDVDKMDYLARDTLHAFGVNGIADLIPKLLEKACVAWGRSNVPELASETSIETKDDNRSMHLMICYPEEMTHNILTFFERRYKEHQRLYTHPKTQAANYMICDILLLAEPYLLLNTDKEGHRLPISRAMLDPTCYLGLRDSIVDIILSSDKEELRPARELARKFQAHSFYKKIGKTIVISDQRWQKALWDMSEDEIETAILDGSDLLQADDVIVEKRKIHHGQKEKNPVDDVRFITKRMRGSMLNEPKDLPVAIQIDPSLYVRDVHGNFQQKSVRVYCRSFDDTKRERLKKMYDKFLRGLETTMEPPMFEEVASSPGSPRTQSYIVSQSPTMPSSFNEPRDVTRSPLIDDDGQVKSPLLKRTRIYDRLVKTKL